MPSSTADVRLNLDLTEGWSRDQVVVSVRGDERCRLTDVTTRTQLGLATTVGLDVPGGEVEIHVALPERAVTGTCRLRVEREVWVAVSVVAGALEFRSQARPFGYV